MNLIKTALSAGVSALLLSAAPTASALALFADYSDPSLSGGIWQTSAGQILGSDPGNGAVNVTAVFKSNISAAFTYLGNSVLGGGNLTVQFGLDDLHPVGADGYSQVIHIGPNGLPDVTKIVLDNSAFSSFFLDPTPFDNSEYTMNYVDAMLGGGLVNVGRYGSALAGSAAANRTDILTLAMHELIHSAALSADTPEGSPNRKRTIPTTLTGFASDFDLPFITGSNHIDPFAQGAVFAHTVTSEPSFGNNDRWLLTGVEIFGICVVQGCTPSQVNPNLVSSVPEPGTMMLLAPAFALMATFGRRRKLRA